MNARVERTEASTVSTPKRESGPSAARVPFTTSTPAGLALGLQRAIGNAAFARAVAAHALTQPRPAGAVVQRCGPAGCRNTGPHECAQCRDRRLRRDDEPALEPEPTLRRRRLIQRVVYTPGVMHDHRPSGRWADVQASPNSGWRENIVCSNMSPSGVIGAAIWKEFDDKPLALDHLNWYLSTGSGRDYVEDTNLANLLRTDPGVQRAIAAIVPSAAPPGGTYSSWLKIEQSHYTNQDFRFAFGAIDRLDIEVDYGARTLHAWFQDRYEWHPVYPFYSALSGDAVRPSNCVHAALVEIKAGGVAKDYWMKGEATVPLSVLPATGGGGTGSSDL